MEISHTFSVSPLVCWRWTAGNGIMCCLCAMTNIIECGVNVIECSGSNVLTHRLVFDSEIDSVRWRHGDSIKVQNTEFLIRFRYFPQFLRKRISPTLPLRSDGCFSGYYGLSRVPQYSAGHRTSRMEIRIWTAILRPSGRWGHGEMPWSTYDVTLDGMAQFGGQQTVGHIHGKGHHHNDTHWQPVSGEGHGFGMEYFWYFTSSLNGLALWWWYWRMIDMGI